MKTARIVTYTPAATSTQPVHCLIFGALASLRSRVACSARATPVAATSTHAMIVMAATTKALGATARLPMMRL